MSKKLLIGLGNPGEEYANNRHNAGHLLLDTLATGISNFQFPISNENWIFVKTRTFMNESGKDVKKLADFYKIHTNDLYIAYDDLDLPLGTYKIVKGKGPRQHNGEKSVSEALGTREYWHVRIGIENRTLENRSVRTLGKEYVLQDFTKGEREILDGVLDKICQTLVQQEKS